MPWVPKVCGPDARGVKVPVISTVCRVSWVTPSGRSAPIHWMRPPGTERGADDVAGGVQAAGAQLEPGVRGGEFLVRVGADRVA